MSIAVGLFQSAIFLIIVFSAFGGRVTLIKTTATIAAFTLTTIFMPWLMALQFTTVIVAFLIGYSFAKPAPKNDHAVKQIKTPRR